MSDLLCDSDKLCDTMVTKSGLGGQAARPAVVHIHTATAVATDITTHIGL